MSDTNSELSSSPLEDSAKRAEESIGEFEAHLVNSMPEGLNSRLSRHERALLKTYIMWRYAHQHER